VTGLREPFAIDPRACFDFVDGEAASRIQQNWQLLEMFYRALCLLPAVVIQNTSDDISVWNRLCQ